MSGAIVVQTTTATLDEAEAIAALLLGEGLAACVQILPIRSRYIWKGEIEAAEEQLLLIKTREALFEPVRARIRSRHSYETPEILATPATAGDADYLAWLAESARG